MGNHGEFPSEFWVLKQEKYGKWNLEIKRCVRMATEMIHVRNDSKNSG
jgi:hypothetical protein